METKPKVLVVLGQTATGKSALGVKLAKEFNGEVISVDSRQIYKGLDIGSGKINPEEMKGIPHHGIGIVEPSETYSMIDFQEYCLQKISEILERGKLPIMVGGTGFFIQGIVDNLKLPEAKPNPELRKKLSQKSNEELFELLKAKDSVKAEKAKDNPHRLVRYLEIIEELGEIPETKPRESIYDFIQIGVELPSDILKEKIYKRVDERLTEGMEAELKGLHENGLSLDRIRALGFDSRYIIDYWNGDLTIDEMTQTIKNKEWQYAKRQKTWFKKDGRITWFNPEDKETISDFVSKQI